MKRVVLTMAILVCAASSAWAQKQDMGYVAGVGGLNVASGKTSGVVGAEGGVRMTERLDGFVEFGWVADFPSALRDDSASAIAGELARRSGQPASYNSTTSTLFGSVGVKYRLASRQASFGPYALGAVGFAHMNSDTTFSVNGSDVTSSLPSAGVTLGTDLSGSVTKATVVAGVGVIHPWGVWDIDVSYRYSRVFTDEQGTNGNRVQVGFGRRF